MKKLLPLVFIISLLSCQPSYAGLKAVSNSGGGGGSVTNRCTNLTAQQCAANFGYAIPTEWGAHCDGTTDDAAALEHAAAASGFPVLIAGTAPNGTILNCVLKTQLKATVANEAFFAFPNSPVYDANTEGTRHPTLTVNNSNGLFTNNCAIDIAGFAFTMEGFNIKGDYVGTGTTAICTSVAPSGNPLPWLGLRHMSIANFDDGVGYAINATTGLPTGTLGDNLIEGIYEDVTFEENGWASYQNYSDLKYTDGRVTGNDCGGIVLSGGGQGNHLSQIRFESNAAHQFCGSIGITKGASLTATGIDNLCSNCSFENDAGAGIELTGAWGNFTMSGYFKGEAAAARAGYDADIVFSGNGSSIGGASFAANHIKVSTFPKYIQKFTTANDNHIAHKGGSAGSGAYSVSFSDVSAFSPTDVTIDVPGEATYQMGQTTVNTLGTSMSVSESGDQFGTSKMLLESRVGLTGVQFNTDNGLPVDIMAHPGSLYADMRLEPRGGSVVRAGNATFGEWQWTGDPTGTPSIYGYMGSAIFGYTGQSIFGSGAAPISGTTVGVNGNIDIVASGYLNFGATNGTSGYGMRDNGGTMEIKNSGGSWAGVTALGQAEQTISFQPGLITSVTATKSVFGKFVKASTVDNIEGSAFLFSCVSNPTITLFECGTSATCASSPVTIGTVTVTAAGTVVDGTVSNAAITAGDYVAWALTAGTCTSLDISATSQVHSN